MTTTNTAGFTAPLAVEYGDDWLVMLVPGRPPLASRVAALWDEADRHGRPRPAVTCQLHGEPRTELVERRAGAGRIHLGVARGPAAEVEAEIGRLGELDARWHDTEVRVG